MVLLVALAGVASARPAQFYIVTEHAPPASMVERGKVTGFATDKIRAAMDRAGLSYTIELLPWKRAYTVALRRPDACVFSTSRTPEREPLFKWVGPTDQAEWVLMGRADKRYQLRTLDDARHLRIGTYNGDARDEFLRARGFRVDSAPNDLVNPRKLLAGRIDLWAAGLRPDSQILERNGWSGKIVPVLVFHRVQVYLACNRAVSDALIERLNDAVREVDRDGTVRRIERQYAP